MRRRIAKLRQSECQRRLHGEMRQRGWRKPPEFAMEARSIPSRSEADKHTSDGIAVLVRLGTGNPGDCQRQIGTAALKRAPGHRLGDIGMNGRACGEQLRRYADQLGFRRLGVGDEAACQDGGRSNRSRQAMREHPGRAGFGCDQAKSTVRRQPDEPIGQCFDLLEPSGRYMFRIDAL